MTARLRRSAVLGSRARIAKSPALKSRIPERFENDPRPCENSISPEQITIVYNVFIMLALSSCKKGEVFPVSSAKGE